MPKGPDLDDSQPENKPSSDGFESVAENPSSDPNQAGENRNSENPNNELSSGSQSLPTAPANHQLPDRPNPAADEDRVMVAPETTEQIEAFRKLWRPVDMEKEKRERLEMARRMREKRGR
ncbi:MAG: hypothetical protein AB8B55_20145 [Mariniblastus sp.]